MQGIVKTFGSLTALDHVDFDLRQGEIHALLGENGAGKSTLMNLLYGLLRPDSGQIYLDGQPVAFSSPHDAIAAGIGMVHQHFKLVPRLTVAENVLLGDPHGKGLRLPSMRKAQQVIAELADRSGLVVKPDAVVRDLSVGEQQRVEIIRALHHGARVLILDEPTASLTPVEVHPLLEKLKGLASQGTSIIIITHHLDEVMLTADRVTVLRRGRNVGTTAANATTTRELARMMVDRDVSIVLNEPPTTVRTPVADDQRVVLELEGLNFKAASSGDRAPEHAGFHDVSLYVRAGENVTVAGVEGNGQSELEEVLLGLRHAASGRYDIDGQSMSWTGPGKLRDAGVGFVHSDRYRHGLIRELSIADNLVYHRLGRAPFGSRWRMDRGSIAEHGDRAVSDFSISATSSATLAGTLSGGNAQKVVLARAFSFTPKVIVAAQPTRGLDVGAIEFVWAQLVEQRDNGVGILLITTDLEEVLALSDRCYVMYRGGISETVVDRHTIGLALGGAPSEPLVGTL
jgi:simple sugar transport system ATP-binding protein